MKKLKHIKSVVIGEAMKVGVNFSPLAQVDLFGMSGDSLGSQDWIEADFVHETVEASSQNGRKFSYWQFLNSLKFIQRLKKPLLSEVMPQDSLVDVLPSSFDVDEPNCLIEDWNDLLKFWGVLSQSSDCLSDYCFRTVSGSEIGEKVVDNVALAVLLGTHQLPLEVFFSLLAASSLFVGAAVALLRGNSR